MSPGRCVSGSASLGCYNNVTGHIQSECDGKRECSIFVSSLGQQLTSCPRDLMFYLYVHFTCVEGNIFVIDEFLELQECIPVVGCVPPALYRKGVSLTETPPGQRPPGQRPPRHPPWQTPPLVDRQMPVKIFLCPKLRLRAVTIMALLRRKHVDVLLHLKFLELINTSQKGAEIEPKGVFQHTLSFQKWRRHQVPRNWLLNQSVSNISSVFPFCLT